MAQFDYAELWVFGFLCWDHFLKMTFLLRRNVNHLSWQTFKGKYHNTPDRAVRGSILAWISDGNPWFTMIPVIIRLRYPYGSTDNLANIVRDDARICRPGSETAKNKVFNRHMLPFGYFVPILTCELHFENKFQDHMFRLLAPRYFN